ncbi:hypothetical protein ACOMHN_033646 [Nucella lapillus]
MTGVVDIDPVLHSLGPRGRFQLWQMVLVSMGGMCAQNQLFDIIFIGQDVPFRCAAPNTTSGPPDLPDVTATSTIRYDKCSIIVTNNVSNVVKESTYDCVYGYEYDRAIDASFMSEFGLVCDRYLLVSLVQTILVLGQAFGAFGSSIISDRIGRKPVLIGSQLGLLIGGMAIGASPSYPALVIFKFFVGSCQQGVVAGISTLGIELYPCQHRSLSALIIALWWAAGGCSMALFAYLLRQSSWRVLQYSLTSLSVIMVLLQFFLMEESVRWLAANGRKQAVMRVLQRAARANGKNLGVVLATLHRCQQQSTDSSQGERLNTVDGLVPSASHRPVSLVIDERRGVDDDNNDENNAGQKEPAKDGTHSGTITEQKGLNLDIDAKNGNSVGENGLSGSSVGENGLSGSSVGENGLSGSSVAENGLNGTEKDGAGDKELKAVVGEGRSEVEEKELSLKASRRLTVLDMFRHRTLRFNALLTFFAWFTVAFVVFTLYLMSTSYAGDPYLNYFLAALMEAPPAFIIYFGVDRLGRKLTVQGLFALAGVGCIASAICLVFPDNSTLARMSSIFALVGILGGSGAFGGLFFYTPEYFPTNMRNQALGTGSTVGRVGGMIAPFMKNFSLIVLWGPGVITGSLCVLVVICVYFLPETRGKQLPTDIEEIEAWYTKKEPSRKEAKEEKF